MSKRKRKHEDWKLFPPTNGASRPKYSFESMTQTQVDPLQYYMVSECKYRKCIKPKHIRFVQQNLKLQPYLDLFRQISINARRFCKTYNKNNLNMLKALDEIIPSTYFGNRRHRRKFYKLVNVFLTRSKAEYIPVKKIIEGYEFSEIPWLKNVRSNVIRRRFLYNGNVWLLEKIVKPITYHLYYPLETSNSHEVVYIPKHIWRCYKDKIIHKLKQLKYITPVDNFRRTCVAGELGIIPKGSLTDYNNFRLITKIRRKFNYEHLLKTVRSYVRTMCKTDTRDIYYAWKDYLDRVRYQKIYAIKVDVKDAYGNICLEFLVDHINEDKHLNTSIKNTLINHLSEQYIEITKSKNKLAKIYKWNHGLMQGSQLSGILCELYMSYIDNLYLIDVFKPNCLVHRVVDDYLFCSTEVNDVKQFLNKITIAHEINNNKTQGNVEPFKNLDIIYCGKVLNLKTFEIKGHYKFKPKSYIHNKFKIWDKDMLLSTNATLIKAMNFRYNSYHFSKAELNTHFNTEKTVLDNFFHSMTWLAFKFHAVVQSIYDVNSMEFYGHVITGATWFYSNKFLKKTAVSRGKYFTNNISFGLLVKISYSAFLNVLQRRHVMYKELISEIKRCRRKIYLNDFNIRIYNSIPDTFKNVNMSRKRKY